MMKSLFRCAVIVFFVAYASASLTAGEQLTLVEDGQARAAVITADTPSPIAAYAAEELVHHIEKATGVRLETHTESEAPDSPHAMLYVGMTRAAEAAGAVPDGSNSEEFTLRVDTDRAYLVGREKEGEDSPLDLSNRYSGTLWAVYELLEKHVGVRWLWPGALGTVVPQHASLQVPLMDEQFKPHLTLRHMRTGRRWFRGDAVPHTGQGRRVLDSGLTFSEEGYESYTQEMYRFLRRHRMGESDTAPPRASHRFSGWWREYGQEHPEWFAYSDGKRGHENPDALHVSMCVSNTELHEKIISLWREEREENPNQTVPINLGEADTRAACECDACREWDAPQLTEEELAGMPNYIYWVKTPVEAGRRYARFYKEIHRLASAIDPDAVVTAFAYVNYIRAPQDIELHPNIVLSFCPWPRWFFPRLPQEQEWVRRQWRGWAETGATLYYRPNYLHDGYVMPHNYARQMGDILRFTLQYGSVATDFDTLLGQWSAQGPTLYLLMRLHTRPEATIEELLNEYYIAFGPAAQAVRAYFEYWEAHSTALRLDMYEIKKKYGANRLHLWPRFVHELYPRNVFDRAEQLLDRAAGDIAAAGPSEPGDYGRRFPVGEPGQPYEERVEFLRRGLEHARKCARIAGLFADDDVEPETRRRAMNELVEFRRSVEHLHIADFLPQGQREFMSWGQKEGFDFE